MSPHFCLKFHSIDSEQFACVMKKKRELYDNESSKISHIFLEAGGVDGFLLLIITMHMRQSLK